MNYRKVALLAAVALVILGVFLSVSRAPALTEKALMGTRTDVTAIAFDTVVDVSANDASYVRVIKNTLNWSYTNWKGMTFGVLFGATILTLLRALPIWSWRPGRIAATLQGLIGGAPLGVCVNCATPISQGLHRAGLRLETSLATMMSSPSLNFIVITMMLALFQAHFITIKLGVTLAFILLGVPLIVWLSRTTQSEQLSVPVDSFASSEINTTWSASITSGTRELLSNLWFIIKISVPLMLLAGLLGAIVVEAISFDELAALPQNLWSYLGIAIVGTLLPVPIAFDVVITAALLAAGLPPGLAMTLFFSLSIFSIFPMLVIARDVSTRLSFAAFACVVVTAVLAGVLTDNVHRQVIAAQESAIDATISELELSLANAVPAKVQLARSLCAEAMPDDPACLEELVRNEAFGFTDSNLCTTLRGTDAETGNICQRILDVRLETRRAIESNDPSLCTTPDCKQEYLNALAHEAGTLGRCSELMADNEGLCRLRVLRHRVRYFRSEEACSANDIGHDRDACLQQVATMVATEQVDLDTCFSLPARSQHSCVLSFISGQMMETGGTYDCSSPRLRQFRSTCDQFRNSEIAYKTGDFKLCEKTPPGFSRICIINTLTRAVKSHQNDPASLIPDSLSSIERTQKYRTAEHAPVSGVEYQTVLLQDNVLVESSRLQTRSTPTGRFARRDGDETGISAFWQIDATDLFEPFGYGKGIAIADINNDEYPDLVLAHEKGVYVYQNLGDKTFGLTADLRPDDDFNAFVVSLVDFNNDGAPDLFVSGYGGKRVLYLNEGGKFGTLFDLPPGAAPVTIAAGFADIDRDGDLDVAIGNWAYGIERNFRTHTANNELWTTEAGNISFNPVFDAEPAGQTLSVLMTDLNGDELVDIVIGNDRQIPDVLYIGDGSGGFSYPPKGFIQETSLNTMSYEAADFNNDSQIDLFSTDMRFDQSGKTSYCDTLDEPSQKTRCQALTSVETMIDQHDINGCLRLENKTKLDCLHAVIMTIAIREKKPELCNRLPESLQTKRQFCEIMTADIPAIPDVNLNQFPSQLTSNKLLLGWGSRFIDVTDDIGVARSNWSWNARAIDVDSDGFQDILVGNGYGFGAEGRADFIPDIQIHSNILYRNDGGNLFVPATDEIGLTDYTNTPSFSIADVDRDGDPDVITYSQIAGVRLYENEVNDNNIISFEIQDHRGNSHCVGCIIRITSNLGTQMREIKLSGGFLSYDEPVAHFGLAEDEMVTNVEITWSTGGKTTINQPLTANHRFRITRQ